MPEKVLKIISFSPYRTDVWGKDMDIEIKYRTSVLKGKRHSNGMPMFEDEDRLWNYKTKAFATSKATVEALTKFYQWAVDNESGAIVLQITYKDFV